MPLPLGIPAAGPEPFGIEPNVISDPQAPALPSDPDPLLVDGEAPIGHGAPQIVSGPVPSGPPLRVVSGSNPFPLKPTAVVVAILSIAGFTGIACGSLALRRLVNRLTRTARG
jgi:hypothetical protein